MKAKAFAMTRKLTLGQAWGSFSSVAWICWANSRRIGSTVIGTLMLACASAPAPVPTPADEQAWVAASSVTLTFNADNVRGCKLLGSVEFVCCGHLPPKPAGLKLASVDLYDQALLLGTARLGGNFALKSPAGEPESFRRDSERLSEASPLSAESAAIGRRMEGVRWIVGEAYQCGGQ